MLRNIAQIFFGNGLAQAIQFFALFLLVQIYSPEDFSKLSIVQSYATIFCVILSLQLHNVIPLSRGTRKQCQIFSMVIVQIFIFFSMLSLVVYLIQEELFLGLLLGLLLALYNSNISLLSSKNYFQKISKIYVIRAVLIVFFQFLLADFNYYLKIVFAVLLAEFLVQFCFYSNYKQMLAKKFSNILNRKCAINVYSKNKDFLVFGSLSEIVAILTFFIPLFYIEMKLGAQFSGSYGMANRIVWGPVVLVSASICQVLYSRLGSLEKKEALNYVFGINKLYFLAFSVFSISTVFFLNGYLYSFVGSEWSYAIDIIPYMYVWAMVYFTGSIYRLLFRVLHIQKYLFWIDIFYASLLTALLFVIQPNFKYTMYLVILASAINFGIVYSIMLWFKVKLTKLEVEKTC